MKQISVFLTICFASILAACTPDQTTASPPTAIREDLPIFPGAEELVDDTTGVYYYEISNTDHQDIQRFYKKEMPDAGWEYLGTGDMSSDDAGEAYALWFAKGEDIVTVEIHPGYGTAVVLLRFE